MADIYVATTGNDSTGTGASGNPYATPGKAASVAVAGDTIYLKYGTYTRTSASYNVAGGGVDLSAGGMGNPIYLIGYDTTATRSNTDANRPTFTNGAFTSVSMIQLSTYAMGHVRNLIIDGNSQSGVTGIGFGGQGGSVYRCTARNCVTGFSGVTGGMASCIAWGCTTGFSGCNVTGSYARGGTTGFSGCNAVGSIAHLCGTGFSLGQNTASRSVAYDNTGSGFSFDYARGLCVDGLVVYLNGGYGISYVNQSGELMLLGCAFGSNTSGDLSGSTDAAFRMGQVSLSANPFDTSLIAALTDASPIEDVWAAFRPNSTAGGGAALRAAGFIPYADIGAVQSQASAGGGLKLVGRGGLAG